MFKATKKDIRKQYRAIRRNISQNYCINAAELIVKIFNQNLNYIKGKVVALYTPIDGEINTMPLINNLLDLEYEIAVPGKSTFEKWGRLGEEIIPDTIIIPMIAFDDHFNRLGFGGGWYDRIMQKLSPLKKVFIGVAYERQYCKNLPVEEHDHKLHIIITEERIRVTNQSFYHKL
ncbi:MAG: 5-formyltetrahydrofolate cyclo-ligase [Wolbachia endosymbiont of Fragariocoptes setiger]|nr:5-formyltetrahydrofolate cyclo-ligase [Wolbachia endosymbiont of Fragariocoptes setiger]